jgi:chromosome partitioning protein
MHTIAVASSKGGVGKTTIACCLAWRASLDEPGKVAAIDLNRDQGNFEQWAGLRDKPLKGIELIKDYGDLTEAIPQLAIAGFEWAIIDTMPGDLDVIELATLVCDVLLVPIKTSIYDAAAILPMLEIARDRRKPFTFVLSDVDTRHKVLNAEVRGNLKTLGPLWKGHISHLQSYIVAANRGKVAPEIDLKAREEIEELWAEIKRLASQPRPAPRRGEGRANV